MRIFITFLIFILTSLTSLANQVSIIAENDFIYHTDNFFTHGTRLQYIDDRCGYTIGQNIYTPHDKNSKDLIPTDRPYAGYLYGSIFDTIYSDNGDSLWGELQVGMIGPDTYAEQTQIFIHELIHSKIPLGWDNQIPNHFAFLLINRYTTHIYEKEYFAIDPYIGSSLGNLADIINIGFNIYAGYNLPPDRNQQRIIPFKGNIEKEWNSYAYLYAGIEPKLVLYNMLLEDHRFSIHPESFVYDRNVGAVFGCEYFELSFTLCFRSKEFEEQYKAESFGSAKISVNF